MNAIWLKVKEYAKTVAAFVAGVVGSVIVNLFNGSTPWPSNKAEWIQLAIASFGPAIATWLTTNKITQKQIDNDPNVIGGVVVSNEKTAQPDYPSIVVANGGTGGGGGGSYARVEPINPPPSAGGWTSPYA